MCVKCRCVCRCVRVSEKERESGGREGRERANEEGAVQKERLKINSTVAG
jgi:hypothetical protein